jgi:hypothetical protein
MDRELGNKVSAEGSVSGAPASREHHEHEARQAEPHEPPDELLAALVGLARTESWRSRHARAGTELRDRMNAVGLSSDLVVWSLEAGEEDLALAREHARAAQLDGRRLQELVEGLLQLTRPPSAEREPFDLQVVLRRAVRAARAAGLASDAFALEGGERLLVQGMRDYVELALIGLLETAAGLSPTVALEVRGEGELAVVALTPAPPLGGERLVLDARPGQGTAGLAALRVHVARWVAAAHGGSLEVVEESGGRRRCERRLPLAR